MQAALRQVSLQKADGISEILHDRRIIFACFDRVAAWMRRSREIGLAYCSGSEGIEASGRQCERLLP